METARQVETGSDLASFLATLMRDGQAVVGRESIDLTSQANPQLEELDFHARADIAIAMPELSLPAARWAAILFYQLCQFVTCRDIDASAIHESCSAPCPAPRSPATDWSVDLLFRHLPRLFEIARYLSNGDPLVDEIRRLGRDWPLSSVGLPGIESIELHSFIRHPGLMRLYTDRILAVQDMSRLSDPVIEEQIRADLGNHHSLAPQLAKKLFPDPAHQSPAPAVNV